MKLPLQEVQEGFLVSTAAILFVTTGVIFCTAFRENRVLALSDALLGLRGRVVFYLAGGIMLAVSAALLVMRNAQFRLGLTLWLALVTAVYHFGMASCGGADLFVCLGNLNSPVPFSPQVMNGAVTVLIGWMLVGSAGFLVAEWLAGWRMKRSKGGYDGATAIAPASAAAAATVR